MPIVLFDTPQRNLLHPFTYTRAIADIRCGIFTCRERWEKLTGQQVYVLTASYLQHLYPVIPAGQLVWINAAVMPDTLLVGGVLNLRTGEALMKGDELVAAVSEGPVNWDIHTLLPGRFKKQFPYDGAVKKIVYPWHLFQWNDPLLRYDYRLLTTGVKRRTIISQPGWTAPENIFIEEGASVLSCAINASEGPVFIARNAVVMEGCMIRGPFAMGEGSVLKMGTRIYGATTLGPHCIAGGEIKNTVMTGYSNKAHDGYLGDAVLGEWCNLGAGTSCSNIKNSAAEVYMETTDHKKTAVGLKCGLLVGDYSRSAINTSFNTGTFAGISSNIFGQGLTPRYLPNFTWGFDQRYVFDKAVEHLARWKQLKQRELTPEEIRVLEYLFKQTIV